MTNFIKNIFCRIIYGYPYEVHKRLKEINRLIDLKDTEIREYEAVHPRFFRTGNEKEYWTAMKLIREKGKLIDQMCGLTGYENPYANPVDKAVVELSIDENIKKHT